jgi:hypothetical protein
MYPPEIISTVIFVSIVGILAGMILLPVDIVVEDSVSEEELME